ncbi:MAG: N-acetyltransferase [Paracoccaceae bacterium]
MDLSATIKGREQEIIDLVTATFTASEGASEGTLIGGLTRDLLEGTPEEDLFVFVAEEGGVILGAILFSRLAYPQDGRVAFLLAPVAVATARQGQGIGQTLLSHGLSALREAGVDIVLTYGDPNYYSKVGFQQISETIARPPFELSLPHGWLAQSLGTQEMTPLKGPSTCAAALSDPAFW